MGDTIINAVTGEWLDLRQLFPIETWVPVIAINAHAAQFGLAEPLDAVTLREVNVILTDVGGDPYGQRATGFDPTEGLDTLTATTNGVLTASNVDYALTACGFTTTAQRKQRRFRCSVQQQTSASPSMTTPCSRFVLRRQSWRWLR